MYYFAALLSGVVVAVMLLVNGRLNDSYGIYVATVIIHITGLIAISLPLFDKKNRPWRHERLPLYVYSGGAIGVATTLFNIWSFELISLTAITGLGLLGQAISSIVIDHFGLGGMRVCPFNKRKIGGIACIVLGIVFIMGFDAQAQTRSGALRILGALLALAGGVTVVVSRIVNGKLAHQIGLHGSTFYNYVVGLGCALLIAVIHFATQGSGNWPPQPPHAWVFTGGLLGVAVVLLSNFVVRKISSLSMTALAFVGQVFAGMLLDYVLSGVFSLGSLLGGLAVVAGLFINARADQLCPVPEME